MALPKTLKVGAHTFVVKKDPGMGERKEEALGKVNAWECAIAIDTTLPETKQEEVFLHELIHTAHDMLGLEDNFKMTPEQWVTRVTKPLYTILKENGMLVFPKGDEDG